MIVFGIDIPFTELLIAFLIVSFLILLEIVGALVLIMIQLKKTKEVISALHRLTDTLLEIKKKEMERILGKPP